MIDSKQLLHELARLKARQVAAGLQMPREPARSTSTPDTPPSSTPKLLHGSHGAPAGLAVGLRPGAAPRELHLVTDFRGRVLECDAQLAVLLTGAAELKGAGIDDFAAMSGQPEFSALFDRIRTVTRTDTFSWRGALRTAHTGDVPVVANLIAHPGGAGTLSWLVRVQEADGAVTPKQSISDLAFAAATDAMMLT
ncbi:MAG: hypothetical protein WCE38_19955, partial [Burkholderiales bacterium]